MSRSGSSNFSNNSDSSVHGGIEPSTRVGSSTSPSPDVERSVTAISRSGASTPPAEANGLSFSHKPLAQFSVVSGVLINGLLGLTNNFLKKKLIGKDKSAETESAEIAGRLFAKQIAFNSIGGLISRSDIVFEDVELSQDENNILAKNGISGHGSNLHSYLEKEAIKKFIKDHVDSDYTSIFLGEEKESGTSLVDSVYTLVELLTRPVEILEHEKKVAKLNNRAPRLSETDLSVNTAKNAVERQVKSLLLKKGKTSKANEIQTASTCIQKAVQVVNIIYAEKGKEAVGEEKIAKLREEIETLSNQDVVNKEEIAKLQASIDFQQSALDSNKEEIDAKGKVIFEKTQALDEAKETHNRLIGEVSEAHTLNLKLNGSIIDKEKAIIKLNSQITSLESDIVTANAEIQGLIAKQSGLTAEIKVLGDTVAEKGKAIIDLNKKNQSALDAISKLETCIEQNKKAIATLESENKTYAEAVNDKVKENTSLVTQNKTLSSEADKRNDEIQGLKKANLEAQDEIKSHLVQAEVNVKVIASLKKEKQNLTEALAKKSESYAELESTVESLTLSLTSKSIEIAKLNEANQQAQETIVALQDETKSLASTVATHASTIVSLQNTIKDKSSAYATLQNEHGNANNALAEKAVHIKQLNETNANIEKEVKSLQSKVSANEEVISTLQKEKQALLSAVGKKGDATAELAGENQKLTSSIAEKNNEITELKIANQKLQDAVKSLQITAETNSVAISNLEKDKIAQQNELAKQALALQEFKATNEKLAKQIDENNVAHANEKAKLEKIGVDLAAKSEDLVQQAHVQHDQDVYSINALKAEIAEKDEVIVNLQNEHKAPVVDVFPAAASNPVNTDEINRLIAENAALHAHITNQNQAIQHNLNHMRTASNTSWLKWLGVGVVAAIGVALIATGFGALAGIGLIAGAVLVATGALTLTGTAAKVAYDHAHAANAIEQDIQATEATLVEPVIAAEPIQHIHHFFVAPDAGAKNPEEIVLNVNARLVDDAALYPAASSSHGSFLNFGRSNKVAPMPLPVATNVNASPSP